MKITRIFASVCFLLITYLANSQTSNEQYTSPYKKAIGFKLNPGAISYRSFYTRNKAVEGIGFISIDGFQLTILNEKYFPFANVCCTRQFSRFLISNILPSMLTIIYDISYIILL